MDRFDAHTPMMQQRFFSMRKALLRRDLHCDLHCFSAADLDKFGHACREALYEIVVT